MALGRKNEAAIVAILEHATRNNINLSSLVSEANYNKVLQLKREHEEDWVTDLNEQAAQTDPQAKDDAAQDQNKSDTDAAKQ